MIFDHYHEPVYRFIASRVHRPSDAEDLTQLVFVKALEALPRYERGASPSGAGSSGWPGTPSSITSGRATTTPNWKRCRNGRHADAGPDEIAIVRQDMDAVGAALACLTDEQREAVALRFFAGLSAREAADAMGKQEGTVRGLQFRAIAALRRELGIDRAGRHRGGDPVSRQAGAANDG